MVATSLSNLLIVSRNLYQNTPSSPGFLWSSKWFQAAPLPQSEVMLLWRELSFGIEPTGSRVAQDVLDIRM